MYIVIQSCVGYEKYLHNLLNEFELLFNDLIVILNNSSQDKISIDKHYTIFTTNNNFELSAFSQIYTHLSVFNKYDKFLFLHDTVKLGPQFQNKLNNINSILDTQDFDWAPLSYNFQCMMGIAHKSFIENKWKIYTTLPTLSKKDAIDIEWAKGEYADYSMINLSEKPRLLGRNPRVKNSAINYLDGEERVEIYFESLDLYKYFKNPKIKV